MKSQRELAEEFYPLSPSKHFFVLEESGSFRPHLKWEYVDGRLFYSDDSDREPLMSSMHDDALDAVDLFESMLRLYWCWDFLSVWDWKDDYSISACDGMGWKLNGSIFGNEFSTGGRNGFPSYQSIDSSSELPQRYLLMFYGMLNAFHVKLEHKSWTTLAASR